MAYRAGTNVYGATSTASLTIPGTVATGDVMVLVASYKLATGTGTINTPAGWTTIDLKDLTGATAQGGAWYRVAQAGDAGATLNITCSAGSQQLVVCLGAWSGLAPQPVDWSMADQGSTASASLTSAAETAGAGDTVISFGAARGASNGTVTFTAPGGDTLRVQDTATSSGAQDVAAYISDGTGPGARTITASRTAWAVTGQIVFEAAPATLHPAIVEIRPTANPAAPTAVIASTTAANDVTFAALSSSSDSATMTGATGFTQITVAANTNTTALQTRLYRKVETGGAQTHTFSIGAATRSALAAIVIRGALAAGPIGNAAQTASANGETHTTPSITGNNGSLLIAVFSIRAFPFNGWALSSGSVTAGWVKRADIVGADGTTNMRLMVATLKVTSTTTYTCTATLNPADGEPALAAIVEILPAVGTAYAKTPADSAGLLDSAARTSVAARTPSDPAGLTDNATRSATMSRAPADSAAILDGAATSRTSARAATDVAGITDTASAVRVGVRAAADPAGLTDARGLSRGRTQADAAALTDTNARTLTASRATADPAGVTDTAVTARTVARGTTDPAGITDARTAALTRPRTTSDPAGVTDATARQVTAARATADTAGLTDAAAATLSGATATVTTDTVALTDTAAASRAAGRADPAGIADSIVVQLAAVGAIGRVDVAGIADSLTAVMVRSRTVVDLLGVTDAASPYVPSSATVPATTVRTGATRAQARSGSTRAYARSGTVRPTIATGTGREAL